MGGTLIKAGQSTGRLANFQVTGTDVRVIERGRGTGPWDPNKQVLDPVITR